MQPTLETPGQGHYQYVSDNKGKWLDRWPFIKRFNLMRLETLKWYPAWKDIKKFECNHRGFFQDETPNYGSELDHLSLINGHAQQCGRDAASGLISAHASPHRPWHRIETPDQDLNKYAPVKLWLDDTNDRLMKISAASNIYDVFFCMFEELIHFGVACGITLEDFNRVIRGRSFTVGEYYLGLGADNKVDSFCRWYWMQCGQLVKEFGYDNCTPQTQAAYKNNSLETWRRVIHLIEPNDDRIPNYVDFKNMPYRSIQWEDGSPQDSYLRLRGYEELPILAPRWATRNSSDVYSNGAPGWISLGNAKELQKLEREKLLGIAKITNPPMQRDASVQGEVNTLPGGVTTFSAQLPNAGLKPAYQVVIDLNAIREEIKEVENKISSYYYSDLFKMMIDIDRTGVTATEIAEKKAEKLALISPFVDKVNEEMLTPYLEREFNIALRNNLLLPPPKELQGMELKIVYISTFAQAQRMIGIDAINQWTTGVYQDAQAFGQDALDSINLDEKETVTAEMLGVPAKLVSTPEQKSAKRQARAKQQAQAQQAQMQQAQAEAAAKTGKAVKDAASAPMGQNSALDALLQANPQLTGAK